MLWVSLVWPLNFYSNSAQHTVGVQLRSYALKLTYFTGLMYLKKIFGNVSNAAINLSRRISPTSEVMKITKILDPGCKVAVDSKMQAW